MANENFFNWSGPLGRDLQIDADGRIIANADANETPFIYGVGKTGHALSVDSSGRLLVDISNISEELLQETASASGWVQVGRLPQAGLREIQYYKGEIYAGTHNWLGATSGAVYRFRMLPDGTINTPTVSLSPSGTTAQIFSSQIFKDKLYYATGETIATGGGRLYRHDAASGVDVWENLGRPSGLADSTMNAGFTIMGMGEYDNKLVLVPGDHEEAVKGLFGTQPVLGYDGETLPLESGINRMFDIQSFPGDWGWVVNPVDIEGRLFIHGLLGSRVNVWDGSNLEWRAFNPAIYNGELVSNTVAFGGKIIQWGTNIYQWSDIHNTHSKVFDFASLNRHMSRHEIYNGRLYIADGDGYVYRYDGDSWDRPAKIGSTGIAGFVAVSGTLVAVAQDGWIYRYRESASLARDIDTYKTISTKTNKTIGVLFNHVGIPKIQPLFGAPLNSSPEFQNKPIYTSTHVVTQSVPLSSGVVELDQKFAKKESEILIVGSGSGITLSLNENYNFNINMQNDDTLTLNNPIAGETYNIIFFQDPSGLITWPASVKWAGGTEPTLTTTASGSIDLIKLYYNGNNSSFLGDSILDLS